MPVASGNQFADIACDFQTTFVWTSGPVGGPYTPVNLTGAAARMMIRSSPTSATPTVSISTTPNAQGSIVLGGAAGTIQVTINKATTSLVAGGSYGYDLFIDWANGTTTDFLYGTFVLNPTNVH